MQAMSDEASGADEPQQSTAERLRAAWAKVNNRRLIVVLAAVALVWLGVWTYSSGSAATGAVGSVSTLSAPPPTSAHAPKRADRHKKPKKGDVPTTIPAPPPGLAKTPQAYATALFNDWIQRDRTDAFRVADEDAVKQLFLRKSRHRDQWIAKGCVASGANTNCTWSSADRTLVLTVRNPTASTPVRVVGARLTP